MLAGKLLYIRRWIGTAFSFFVFGLGGFIFPFIVIPVLYLLPGDQTHREKRAKISIHYLFRGFLWFMKLFGILTLQIDGADKLKEAKLVLANHPTLIDVVILIAMIPNANCIVKGRLVTNPFTRGPVKTAGYIINDDVFDVINAASNTFDQGQALVVFPEGTRTTPSEPIKLKRGAANIAVRTSADITPVMIDCTPLSLTKNNPWYQIPDKPMHFRIQVKEVFIVKPYTENIPPSKGARMLTRDLSCYFKQELELYG